ncbi:hypothetical protein AGABI1DRAFT_105131 [Agaricus bisporus var. burnettii JB137-S8]|uniref:ribonuclease Z n=1 Tax=Agaricus bisporus var. burnettii (strain JB137-S8 / ATCC MYA-4627 / FGSC 10392) TaxID=597362 RepID=K5X1D5_AGABU|nr:uncharacterized protein AGABI1DRAFT_105131 [Agaricus bisporus var. burnettii JB137-S8]EKM81596.1 hypothetical protein AGABI1DRAFT_105131 [Agaricus bisporus var. burnettii JB137-S8]
MQSWVTTAVTSLSHDTEPTILVNFENAKYMFNAGENTNRAFLQSSKNWKKMRSVFLTQVTSQRASGLTGIIMTFADNAISKVDVVGPPGLRHYLASMRDYFFRDQLDVKTTEHIPDPGTPHPEIVYKDENITVYSFSILRHALSSLGELTEELKDEVGQKRRRSNLPESPSKVPRFGLKPPKQGLEPDNCIKFMFKSDESSQRWVKKEGESRIADDYGRPNIPRNFRLQLPSFSPPSTFPLSSALAYVVVGPRTRGKVDGKKLDELNVPRNSLRGKLSRGETIQFEVKGPSGSEMRTVRPEDCVGLSEPPAVVIILDVPMIEMIPSVIHSFDSAYKPFRSIDPSDMEKHTVRVVYHLLGEGVLQDERYIDFMKGFPATTEHVVSSSEYSPNPLTFTSHGFKQYCLSRLDPEVFPIPKFDISPPTSLASIPSLPIQTHFLSPKFIIPVRPAGPPKLDPGLQVDLFHPAFDQPQPLPDKTLRAFGMAKEAVANFVGPQDPQLSGVKILPLGTGSSHPTKYRNVLSTLIRTPSGNILLDCGEGTTGQLTRYFGKGEEGIDDILRNLKCIFVSHAHADHHMGLAKLLRQRRLLSKLPDHPLYVVSVRSVHRTLKEVHELEDIGLNDDPRENGVVQVISEALNTRWNYDDEVALRRAGGNEPWLDIQLSKQNALDICRHLDLSSFETMDVEHRTKAFGVFFRHRDGWSIAFTGDTMPTQNVVKVASGATLLIHEASMADDDLEMAQAKAHSTVGQAIQIARDAKAKNVLLTHFSARYPKIIPMTSKPQAVATEGEEIMAQQPENTIGREEPIAQMQETTLEGGDVLVQPQEYTVEREIQTMQNIRQETVVQPQENTFQGEEPVVALALDLAEMSLDKIWKMNMYLPAIEQCYDDSKEEGDEDIPA